jgi:choline-sulfatase
MISPFGQRHGAHWFYAGFNEIHNTGKFGMESAEEVRPVIDKWMTDNAAKDNWYLHINFWDPHTPYRVPLEYGEPFANDPLPKWLDDDATIKKHVKAPGPHSAMDIAMFDDRENPKYPRHPGKITDRKSMRRMIDGYDTAIRYTDDHVGRIVQQLKDAGVYEETAIIISADHGENQGELGIYGEHGTADAITCRIPMIVKWPGAKAGTVDDGLHYNIDFGPTLMDLLGGKPSGLWDGQSYSKTLTEGRSQAREELILSQCVHVCQRSVRFGPWLYMRTYQDGFHLFPRDMLFNLEQDPHEQHNLADRHPEVCREAAWRLMNWHDQQMNRMQDDNKTDPLWTVMAEGGPFHAMHDKDRSPLPEYLQRLEATGRGEAAAELRKKYAFAL